jgi:hypothetical protein
VNGPLLSLETSIFGFHFDDNPRNYHRREAVRTLLYQVGIGILSAITSPIAYDELAAAEPLRSQLRTLLAGVDIVPPDEAAVRRLTSRYLTKGIIPERYVDDARHAASAAVLGADVLVTLNLKHLASEWTERRLNGVNLLEGYREVNMRTPEEVVLYDR